ncbi:MAG: hypothetical protein MUD11_09815 [Rhodobacteraceae bacterium]|jgi:predicted flap endonuclease-1-like 5' DNA nuclease|nr:hypothetical protein [Paracoccaceae bacterium]
MFKEWGFLLGEIWFLLALAGLIGLIAGWIIWGRASSDGTVAPSADTAEADRLRADLVACRKAGEGQAAQIAALQSEVDGLRAAARAAARDHEVTKPSLGPLPVAAPQALMGGAAAKPVAGALSRPAALTGPRGGKGDDLKLIKGVGPKLEVLCNKLGFWHFDQIANWTAAEVAWVDDNLEGFKGRVTRDDWVVQARDLAAGKPPRPGGEN